MTRFGPGASPDLAEVLARRIDIVDGHADVWRLFADGELFRRVVSALAEPFRDAGATKVVGIESRGFVLGGAVALELGLGFVAIRKPGGLLPGPKEEVQAGRDYRGNSHVLRVQRQSLVRGDAVFLVDDWAEEGAQAAAAKQLVERCGARWLGASVIVGQLPQGRAGTLGRYEYLVGADRLAWRP